MMEFLYFVFLTVITLGAVYFLTIYGGSKKARNLTLGIYLSLLVVHEYIVTFLVMGFVFVFGSVLSIILCIICIVVFVPLIVVILLGIPIGILKFLLR